MSKKTEEQTWFVSFGLNRKEVGQIRRFAHAMRNGDDPDAWEKQIALCVLNDLANAFDTQVVTKKKVRSPVEKRI